MTEPVDITPFAPEHLDAAAALLAARHRRDRTREPDFPARFEAPRAARALLQRRLGRPTSAGVVALRRGRVVGYVLGTTFVTPPMTRTFLAPRAGVIGYPDHAVDDEDAIDVEGALYGALAPGWVAAGCLSHYVLLAPTDARTEERWHTLGFGRQFVTAVRDTGALVSADGPGEIRRAKPDDLDTIMGFIDGLHRFEAGAPMWRPYFENQPEERASQARMIDDPACACWIASEDGRPLAMQTWEPPPTYLSPMIVPDRAVYLRHGYTEPAARGRRLGTRLLASAMAWAREAGHERCLLHFTAANRVSTRFWLGHGFRPIEYWLRHRLDERTTAQP